MDTEYGGFAPSRPTFKKDLACTESRRRYSKLPHFAGVRASGKSRAVHTVNFYTGESTQVTQFKVPIVLLAFNRPESTRVVFDAIRKLRPAELLVVLDSPRSGQPDDQAKCAQVRQIVDGVDWPCRVQVDCSTQNLGARRRVASGLDWAFSCVEEAIILEDDCVPTGEFFYYCAELLARYRDDLRIMHIGGTNLAPRSARTNWSYLFSRYALSWGWATWRRAWTLYDAELEQWPRVREGGWLRDLLNDDQASVDKWKHRFDLITRNEFDSWASIWMFSCWIQNALSIIPTQNQITNIGLGDDDATHTSGTRHLAFTRRTGSMNFPLTHPEFVIRDSETDTHVAAAPLMIKDYSGLSGHIRRLRARKMSREDDALWDMLHRRGHSA